MNCFRINIKNRRKHSKRHRDLKDVNWTVIKTLYFICSYVYTIQISNYTFFIILKNFFTILYLSLLYDLIKLIHTFEQVTLFVTKCKDGWNIYNRELGLKFNTIKDVSEIVNE